MPFCLIKSESQKFKKALKEGKIDPFKLSQMTSEQRRAFLTKFTNEANAKQINALFESKLLLKNQQKGFETWVKRTVGITPQIRRDLISRIQKLDKVLDPKQYDQFLQDLASQRLGLGVTELEANNIAKLSQTMQSSKEVWEGKLAKNPDMERSEWMTDTDRLRYGVDLVNLETYVNELKLEAGKISFREQPLDFVKKNLLEVPGTMKSMMASLDNSLWGRQGIKTLLDLRTAKIWTRNFVKSWRDIAVELKGDDAMFAIKVDIYSRPNALNGKYRAGGYGLNVLREEAFPSSLPEKIPGFGRLFKASESAYNGGALRLRADLADRLIAIAEKEGINTLDKTQAEGLGHLVGSMTGRGSLGKADAISKEMNILFFSVKFWKSNFDTVTAHMFDPKVQRNRVARKEAVKNIVSMVASLSAIFALAGALDPDSVEPDPRSTNFGKIKIFGKWVDITGGMASHVRLASYLVPTVHNGKLSLWKKSSTGKWTDLRVGEFGMSDAWDILMQQLIENKLSPALGLFKSAITGEFFGGEKFTIPGAFKRFTFPLSVQNYEDLQNDPTATFVLGSMLFEGLGFSVNSYPQPNIQTNVIPEDKKISNDSFIDVVMLYADAMKTDPETAFNRIFTGQRIRKIDNNTIIVRRIPVGESQAIKKKANAQNPQMKLDHTIPLQLGGSNSRDNLKIVTTAKHSSYTKVENMLGRALKAKKIDKKKAQSLILDFKNGKLTAKEVEDRAK